MFVKINGETHYLLRAVDHGGEVLESFVTMRRDKSAALRFRRMRSLRKFAFVHASAFNHFNQERGLAGREIS
jgi:transposase-like protein